MSFQKENQRILSIGFEGETLRALQKQFNVVCTISQEESSDINWNQLHLLKICGQNPNLSGEILSCFNAIKLNYLQFNDINSRRFYYINGRDSEIYNSFVLTFYEVYRILKEKNIDLVLHSNIPHEGFDYLIYLVAQYLGIQTVMCYQSLISNRFWMSQTIEKFGLVSSSSPIFPLVNSEYRLPNNWFYMKGAHQEASYSFTQMLSETIRRPYRVLPALVRYVYALEFRGNVKKLTKTIDSDHKYIYFPLHLQPELTTSALGGGFSDQLLALEWLSIWVPKDFVIYVKENPKQTEKQRDKFFFKRLAALENVKLLSSSESSLGLIQGSQGVATITGTAGWEALFYGKPVLTFGLAWYREFSGVSQYHEDLKFSDFLANIPPSHHGLVQELDKALQTAGVGVVDSAYTTLIDEFDEIKNSENVVDSIKRYIQAQYSDQK